MNKEAIKNGRVAEDMWREYVMTRYDLKAKESTETNCGCGIDLYVGKQHVAVELYACGIQDFEIVSSGLGTETLVFAMIGDNWKVIAEGILINRFEEFGYNEEIPDNKRKAIRLVMLTNETLK